MSKRILKITVWIAVSALLLGACLVLFGGALVNDFRASRIEKELSQTELPPDTELIEATSFVGNTSGTGSHVEIWAGILIYSALSENELISYFDLRADVFAVPHDLRNQMPYQKDFIDFRTLNGATSGAGYFVISNYYEALTLIDGRGC